MVATNSKKSLSCLDEIHALSEELMAGRYHGRTKRLSSQQTNLAEVGEPPDERGKTRWLLRVYEGRTATRESIFISLGYIRSF